MCTFKCKFATRARRAGANLPLARLSAIVIGAALSGAAGQASGQCEGEWVPGPAPLLQTPVRAFASLGATTIFAGGDFQYPVSGGTAHHIARWNGQTLSALTEVPAPGGEGTNGPVYAVRAVQQGFNTHVYAGGVFTMAGDSAANRVAHYTSSSIVGNASWSPMGQGFNGPVFALELFNNELYAAGAFTFSGATPINRIARWDGMNWQPVGGGFQGSGSAGIRALAVYGGMLYVGGDFETPDGEARYLARWNGASWQYFMFIEYPDPPPADHGVHALIVFDGKLILGGLFYAGRFSPPRALFAYNGTNFFTSLGGDANEVVRALASHDGDLYIGGDFTSINGAPRHRIARRSTATNTWHAVGVPGVDAPVRALRSLGDQLHVGGSFTTPFGEPLAASHGWWIWETTCPCPGDINGDDTVDVNDLLILIGAWGASGANPADLNGDSTVDVNDLLILIGAWGACA